MVKLYVTTVHVYGTIINNRDVTQVRGCFGLIWSPGLSIDFSSGNQTLNYFQ